MQIVHGPRPRSKIRPNQLPNFEQNGEWMVQRKFNGHKNTVYVDGSQVLFFNKGKSFLRYKTPPFFQEQFSSLNLKPGTYWFDSELLNPRVPDHIILYDVLQAEGQPLIGVSQENRLKLLEDLCGHPRQLCDLGIALRVTENIWLAEHWDRDFKDRYEELLHMDLIEGLVLRKKSAPLDNFGVTAYETDAQVRCRKSAKNYQF